jgi:hypothetical protein
LEAEQCSEAGEIRFLSDVKRQQIHEAKDQALFFLLSATSPDFTWLQFEHRWSTSLEHMMQV